MPNGLLHRFGPPDRIHYLLLAGERKPPTIHIPKVLSSGYLEVLQGLPKAFHQFIDPIQWHQSASAIGSFRHYDFSVAHDDVPLEQVAVRVRSCKLTVIFLESRSNDVLDMIRASADRCLIFSWNTEVKMMLSNDPRLERSYCGDVKALLKNLTRRILDLLGTEVTDFERTVEMRVAELKQQLTEHSSQYRADFRACMPNNHTFMQLLAPYLLDVLEGQSVEHSKRPAVLIKSAERVLNAYSAVTSVVNEEQSRQANFVPPLVLSWPYYGPLHKAVFAKMLQSEESTLRNKIKTAKEIVFLEQDPQTYDFTMAVGSDFEPEAISSVVGEFQIKLTVYMDSVSYLHASFQDSPVLRMPITGRSISESLNSFQQSHIGANTSSKRVSARLKRCGDLLGARFPEGFLTHIDQYYDQMVAITDIPIEWAIYDGVPLAFLLDICRLPQTNPSSVMAQFASNEAFGYSVKANILSKTLVICGANSSDPIGQAFDKFKAELETNSEPRPNAVRCSSREEFIRTVEQHHPDLLIVDTHGSFTPDESSYFNIGKERITGDDVLKIQHAVPLVMLSCCLTAPLYGCPNPIAQAFFEAGSRSVVSTFLPISVDRGHLLYRRIIGNLDSAVRHGYHRNWLSYISHNLRSSHIDDYVWPLQRSLRLIPDRDSVLKSKVPWMIDSMKPSKRREAYLRTKEAAINCFPADLHSKAHAFINSQHIIPEAFYYTHLGRADLVQFDVALERMVSDDPRAKSLYDEIVQQNCL